MAILGARRRRGQQSSGRPQVKTFCCLSCEDKSFVLEIEVNNVTSLLDKDHVWSWYKPYLN